MPLPALLLERLKRRKIIKEAQERSSPSPNSVASEEESSAVELRYHSRRQEPVVDEEQEEIIAEDYDDEEEETDKQSIDQAECRANSTEKQATCSSQECTDYDTAQLPSSHSRDNDNDVYDAIAQEHKSDAARSSSFNDDQREEKDIGDIILGYKSVLGCPNKYNIYHECSRYCIERYSDIGVNSQPTLEQRKLLAIILKTYPLTNDWTIVYDPGVRTFYFWNIITNLVSWLPPSMNGFVSVSADQIRRTLKEMEQTH